MNKKITHTIGFIVALILVNAISMRVFKRFDLTEDHRYTLSEATKGIVNKVKSPLLIDVFLEGEDFPSEFRRLQNETRQILEEFEAKNSNIVFNFINPLEDEAARDRNIKQLSNRGLTPMQLNVQESGKTSQAVIFPWALASYNDQTVSIPLIKNKIGASQQDLVTNSVQHLEYAFADGFKKLVTPKYQKIAVLKGNNEIDDKYIADFIKKIGEYYFIAPFTLDSVSKNPQKSLRDLNNYDLVIAAKPTEAFTEEEKFVLDQYTMNGGKSLWLVDAVAIEKDSLYNENRRNFAVPRDLNLTDFFFKYGVRINPVITSSFYSAPLTVAFGEGSNAQFQHLRWPYSPLASTNNIHPIVNNLNLVRFDFANQLDTLKNNIKKTILLESAPLSKLEGMPKEIRLDLVTQEQDPAEFNKGNQPLAVLLEGEFESVYKNRVKPFPLKQEKSSSVPTKMIVIADGDVIKNDVVRNIPQELGFDRWTGKIYGNKEFLLNAVNYLLDDTGLINIRSKTIEVAFLNHQKIAAEKTKWQLINIALPLVLLAIFGFTYNYIRKKRYAA
ncbi:gliding motility-associated ABC transporter substrate-binding protein GldG [Aestuariibaculum sediminum]|nr:gliding motility-associated ABC transporter substrate-binding protein GldG [Aestuariibaculum sediminum]